jgi:hypothetical protein
MNMRGLLLIPLILRTGIQAPEAAPPVDELRILVSAYTIGAEGGERPNVGFGGPGRGLVMGQTQRSAFSQMPTLCAFNVRSAETHRGLNQGAVGGWTIDVTPIRVVDRTVSFHVSWTRFGDDGKTPAERGDLEATLRPGESLPIDVVQLSPRVREMLPASCDIVATSARVGVEYRTSPTWDRRLLETDVWLIEHLPNGTERNQHTQVRGQFNVPTSFFFDDIATADGVLDIGGTFTILQMAGYVELTVEPWSRVVDSARDTSMVTKAPLRSRLKPVDVLSIELPPIKALTAPRTFSLRIQTKQIR